MSNPTQRLCDKKLVIKLSGAALYQSQNAIDLQYLERFACFVAELTKSWKVGLTVGGGTLARNYIAAARKIGCSDSKASVFGGDIGLINCRLAIATLQKSGIKTCNTPIKDFDSAEEYLNAGCIPVLFGHWHGLTSDSVAAYFADYISADIVLKLSQVDAVYTRDPDRCPDAVANARLSHEELESLAVSGDKRMAGETFVIDLVAARRLRNSGIPLWVLHLSQLEHASEVLGDSQTARTILGTLIGNRRD